MPRDINSRDLVSCAEDFGKSCQVFESLPTCKASESLHSSRLCSFDTLQISHSLDETKEWIAQELNPRRPSGPLGP